MSAVSGRHLFAYEGFRIDLEYCLQWMVLFGRKHRAVAWMKAALYGTSRDTDGYVSAGWQNVVGVTVSLLFRNGATTQLNSAQARKSTVF